MFLITNQFLLNILKFKTFLPLKDLFIFKQNKMPRKTDKNKEKKPEVEIVDQQKEPCLRALQKKVRNINKKLGEISDLENKNNLKPEQLDKIERKEYHLQEKEKYLEFISIYQQIAKENAQIIRSNQLNELKEIAIVLAARQYGAHLKLPENQGLNNLVKILSAPSSSDLSLSQRVEELNVHLTQVANDQKLKKNYLDFFTENKDLVIINENYSNQPEPRSNKSEENRDEVIQDIDEELHQIDEITGEQHIIVEPHIENPSHHNVDDVQETPKVEAAEEKIEEKIVQKEMEEQIKEVKEPKNEQNKKRRQYNRAPDQDGRKGRRGNYQNKNREGKKTFVPKHDNKEYRPKKEQRSESSSSSDSNPQVRQFKKEERKKMEEQGFIFVDKKTKPKARDQKSWHDKQHGKKHHHHHGPKDS